MINGWDGPDDICLNCGYVRYNDFRVFKFLGEDPRRQNVAQEWYLQGHLPPVGEIRSAAY
jgi:hypothetical protein